MRPYCLEPGCVSRDVCSFGRCDEHCRDIHEGPPKPAPRVSDLKPRGSKCPMWLLPYRPLRAVVSAMQEGASKYAPNNWRNQGDATDWRETYTSALMRHVNAFNDPDESDTDDADGGSGVHHLAHAVACCLIMLYHCGADYVVPNAAKKKEEAPSQAEAAVREAVRDLAEFAGGSLKKAKAIEVCTGCDGEVGAAKYRDEKGKIWCSYGCRHWTRNAPGCP